jgi:hypothetical protein
MDRVDNLYGGWVTLPRERTNFTDLERLQGLSSEDEVPGGLDNLKLRRNRMDTLMATANELHLAMESFVNSVVSDEARDRASVSETRDDEADKTLTTNGVH